ncbi:hypothetical protein QFZ83_006424 [Variovorax sp. W1I1]|nr:hypothetical protein [Variovorax sp. W1I1]
MDINAVFFLLVWLGSARLGSARLGSARLGSARLGSARLGSARLGASLQQPRLQCHAHQDRCARAPDRAEHPALPGGAGDRDRTPPAEMEAKTERLQDEIRSLRAQMRQLDETMEQIEEAALRADLHYRHRCPLDELALQELGLVLQRADIGRCQTTSHRGARGDEHKQRPDPVAQDGQGRARGNGHEEAAGLRRSWLLQRHRAQGLRGRGHRDLRARVHDLGHKAAGSFDKSDFIYIAKDAEYQRGGSPATWSSSMPFRSAPPGRSSRPSFANCSRTTSCPRIGHEPHRPHQGHAVRWIEGCEWTRSCPRFEGSGPANSPAEEWT